MGRKILFANQSSGSLTVDIVNAFEETGNFDRVELFAGKINIRPSVPNKDVKIIKTIHYNNKNIILRILTWMVSYIHLLFVTWFRSKNTELFLITNPPFNTFIPLFNRKKYYILIYDIYPDTLITQHIFSETSIIARLWTKRNKKVFANAEKVFTISEDMKKVVAKYVDEDKISIVYNWSHNERMVPIKKEDNIFLKEHNLQDKFIVLYSGNMGMTHDVDAVVDVANELRNYDKIRFLFIGEGGKKKVVMKKIADYGLSNCLVLPYQDNSVLPYSMGAADIGVVTTATEQTGLSIPSKVNALMSVGSVLLCLADSNSELGRMVDNNELGKCFHKDQVAEMADFIKSIVENKELETKYKTNTRAMSYNFTPENAKQFIV